MVPARITATLFAVTLGVSTFGCSSSSSSTVTTTSPPVTTVPTTSAPTTTLPVRATGSAATGADAAAVLVAAWQDDDRAKAATIADATAVEGMWETPRETITWRGCSTDDTLPEGGCFYRTDSGTVQVNTEKRAAGWVVSSAIYDPLDAGNEVSGDAPDGPPPTTTPPPAATTTVPAPG